MHVSGFSCTPVASISVITVMGISELWLMLHYLNNLAITQGVFLDELKIARVIPINKGENSMLVNKYRPVYTMFYTII